MKAPALLGRAALLVLGSSSSLYAQEWTWAERGGGTGADDSYQVATDAVGNAYVTGAFTGVADFGPFTLTGAGGREAFLVKYAPDGEVLWARNGGGSGADVGWGVAVDAGGNVYVSGEFQGTATFGAHALTSAGDSDIFLAKYTPDGEVIWARRAGSASGGYEVGFYVAVDAGGDAYLAAAFRGTADFGPHTLTSAGDVDIALVRYTPDGDALWARRAGGAAEDRAWALAADAAGNTYLTGWFIGTADFGDHVLTSAGNFDVFVAAYDPDGAVRWAHRAGGSGLDTGVSVGLDAAGHVYVAGEFISATATFGPFTLNSAGANDVFLAKYTTGGEILWARRAGGVGVDAADGLAVHPDGTAYIAGPFQFAAGFGPLTLTSAGSFDVFAAGYSPEGEVLFARRAGGAGVDFAYGVAIGAGSNPLIVGRFSVVADFGPVTLTSAGSTDAFLAQLDVMAVAAEGGPEPAPALSLTEPRPNPSDGPVRFTLTASEAQPITVTLHDVLGRSVRVLFEGVVPVHRPIEVVVDGTDLPGGVYLVRAASAFGVVSRRVMLVR